MPTPDGRRCGSRGRTARPGLCSCLKQLNGRRTRALYGLGTAGGTSRPSAQAAEILRERGESVIGVDVKGVEVTGDLSNHEGRLAAAAEAAQLAGGTVDAVIPCAGLSVVKPVNVAVNFLGMAEFLEALLPALGRSESPRVALAPGTVVTPMTKDLLASEQGRAMTDAYVPMPLNSHQGAESIAHLLIWLTSVENTHCAGQTIYCDGGVDTVLRGDDVWSWNDEAMARKFQEIGARLRG